MSAASYDFTVEQGATWDETFTWKDNSSPPVAIDLTGYSAHMQLRPSAGDSTLYLDLTNGTGITLGGGAGTIRVVLTAAQTTAFSWPMLAGQSAPTAKYDLKVTDAGGTVYRLLKGTITLDLGVTVS